ncbi:alginate O-acetyltransferase AlgX-related protein [Pseudomonas fluorescens]|uniref:alginate O-acetyltransferase AlgX-related protein n=1 Tax=Pseudomonas fluorescens TaxID=294 RepID=UPI00177D0C46|nr:hypothetical protein [Pseudomonas fluorescens]
MKRSVYAFVLAVLLVLLSIPAINIITAPNKGAIKLTEKSFLYNMDFVSRWTARLLYPLGVSTDPDQVIVGKDNWLYLGDMYKNTLSDDRRTATDSDVATAKQMAAATRNWEAYLAGKGVKVFRIMIGPNKGSIYPEHMPNWAKPASLNPTDALLAEAGQGSFIDLRPPLLAAKDAHRETLYFKTDTHWNALGAGVAFRAFAQEVGKVAPELRWPSAEVYEVARIKPIEGGDLARFLRLTASLSDEAPIIGVGNLPVKTTQVDFTTQQVLAQGDNPEVGSPNKPILVKSAGALNDKKVLWLRDSFGSAMSPLMAATFGEVLQLHWSVATQPGGSFTQLVEAFKPDYVFITVVEREARALWSSDIPPIGVIPKGEHFKTASVASSAEPNQLAPGPSMNEYEIQGDDAYVDFKFTSTDARLPAQYLNIDLTCADGSSSVPVQLFWLKDGQPYFDETNSVRFSLRTGQSLIDLQTIPRWPHGSDVRRVRVDIEAVNSCVRFTLGSPSFGMQN